MLNKSAEGISCDVQIDRKRTTGPTMEASIVVGKHLLLKRDLSLLTKTGQYFFSQQLSDSQKKRKKGILEKSKLCVILV